MLYLPTILNIVGLLVVGLAVYSFLTESKSDEETVAGPGRTAITVGLGLAAIVLDLGLQYYLQDWIMTNWIGFGVLVIAWVVHRLYKKPED